MNRIYIIRAKGGRMMKPVLMVMCFKLWGRLSDNKMSINCGEYMQNNNTKEEKSEMPTPAYNVLIWA